MEAQVDMYSSPTSRYSHVGMFTLAMDSRKQFTDGGIANNNRQAWKLGAVDA